MNHRELLEIKAELLCFGIRLTEQAKVMLEQKNRFILEKGFMHAAHFLLDDIVVNTCVSEKYCELSPYQIRMEGNVFLLEKDNAGRTVVISEIDVLPLPSWCNTYVEGYNIGDYLRPHSPNCIACWPYLICDYYKDDAQCRFCSMGDYKIRARISPDIVGEMIQRALKFNPHYEVALSGGTCNEPDRSLNYFSKVCNRARDAGAKYISVETAPPEEMEYIKRLHDSGASAIIMNLEIADDARRKEICPGKATISQQRYFEAYRQAVSIFGQGNVASVLIAGLQPAADIISMSKEMIRIGVVPTIIPFKPLDDCALFSSPIAEPRELLSITKEVGKLLHDNHLYASEQHGCTKCNGCSVEALFEQC